MVLTPAEENKERQQPPSISPHARSIVSSAEWKRIRDLSKLHQITSYSLQFGSSQQSQQPRQQRKPTTGTTLILPLSDLYVKRQRLQYQITMEEPFKVIAECAIQFLLCL